MIKIKGYIISVMCISIVGSIVSMVSPDGDGGGISKNIRLVFGICVVLVCIHPIKDMFYYIKDMKYEWDAVNTEQDSEKYNEIFDKAYTDAEIDNLKSGIKKLLNDKFGIDSIECEIAVAFDENGELRRIFVTLYGNAVWENSEEIENYLYGIFKCEIITAIG